MPFTPEAGRVLGCLVEKQLTTPQQYPLTLNALTAAANQATSRDPVVDLADDAVLAAIDELRSNQLVRVVLPSHGRSVKRYRHVLDEAYGLDTSRCGLLATLLLRGPQTVGELRARTERMVDLPSIGDVQAELAVLAEHPDGLVRLLPRGRGQKEDRWQQIVAAPWATEPGSTGDDGRSREDEPTDDRGGDGTGAGDRSPSPVAPEPASSAHRSDDLQALRTEVASLRGEVSALREELDALREGLGG